MTLSKLDLNRLMAVIIVAAALACVCSCGESVNEPTPGTESPAASVAVPEADAPVTEQPDSPKGKDPQAFMDSIDAGADDQYVVFYVIRGGRYNIRSCPSPKCDSMGEAKNMSSIWVDRKAGVKKLPSGANWVKVKYIDGYCKPEDVDPESGLCRHEISPSNQQPLDGWVNYAVLERSSTAQSERQHRASWEGTYTHIYKRATMYDIFRKNCYPNGPDLKSLMLAKNRLKIGIYLSEEMQQAAVKEAQMEIQRKYNSIPQFCDRFAETYNQALALIENQ